MIKVLKSGLYTSIQDLGRIGYRNIGIPVGGSMDTISAGMANLILNNILNDAVLEITLSGPTLQFESSTIIVLTGGDMSPKINDVSIVNYKPFQVGKGDVLSFGKLLVGARCYLAVKNGVKSEVKLGSKSQFNSITSSSRVCKGDEVKIDSNSSLSISKGVLYNGNQFFKTDQIEVFPGPEFDMLSKNERHKVLDSFCTVSKNNSRMGYQMEEVLIKHEYSQITSPVLPGTIQLLPSGRLVILMRDAQTTGGYPRILQLTEKSISILAQKKKGNKIRFKMVTMI